MLTKDLIKRLIPSVDLAIFLGRDWYFERIDGVELIQTIAVRRQPLKTAGSFSRDVPAATPRFAMADSDTSRTLKDSELKMALVSMNLAVKDDTDLNACESVYQDYYLKGGSLKVLSNVLMMLFEMGYSKPSAVLQSLTPALLSMEKKFPSALERAAFETVTKKAKAPQWLRDFQEIPAYLERVYQFHQEITPLYKQGNYKNYDASIPFKVLENMNGLQDFDQTLSRVKAVLGGINRSNENILFANLSSILVEDGDLKRAELMKALSAKLRPAFPNDKYGSNYRFTETMNYLGSVIRSGTSNSVISTEALASGLSSISEAFWSKIQTKPQKTVFIGSLFRDGIRAIQEGKLQPLSLGKYLETVMTLVDLLGENSSVNLHGLAPGMFQLKSTDDAAFYRNFEQLKSALMSFQIKYPLSDSLMPFLFYVSQAFEKSPSEKWQGMTKDFCDTLSVLTEHEVANFSSQVDGSGVSYQLLFDQTARIHAAKYKDCSFPQLLKRVFQEFKLLIKQVGYQSATLVWPVLTDCLTNARQISEFDQNTGDVKIFLDNNQSLENRKLPLRRLLKGFSAETRNIMEPLCLDILRYSRSTIPLLMLLTHPRTKDLKGETLEHILTSAITAEKEKQAPKLLEEIPYVLNYLMPMDRIYPELVDTVVKLPGQWKETADTLNDFKSLQDRLSEESEGKTQQAFEEELSTNYKLLSYLHFPNKFLNHFMLNRERISAWTMYEIFNFIEYNGGFELGHQNLPELMALLTPYAEMGPAHVRATPKTKLRLKDYIDMSTGALTSLFNYIDSYDDDIEISNVRGIVYNNWARAGALGLSFTKWQYDSMKRWKGQGPSQKLPLMEQSGVFVPLPPRENDKTYHGGFFHYNPDTGLSIEMRRAYIAVSKPGVGTLVIRNSSPVFGRELLSAPAYFSETRIYSDASHLLDPKDLTGKDFQSILGKKLNKETVQVKNHQKIEALMDAFDEAMEPYVAWKCGFKDGKPPAGFREFLQAALMSTKSDGAMTPFGKKKNIKPAWVNRFGLPFVVKSLDINDPKIQAEVGLYLNVLEKRVAINNPAEYAAKIPNLLTFLQEGLSRNLELVLSE